MLINQKKINYETIKSSDVKRNKKAIDIYLERINKIIDQSLPESNGSPLCPNFMRQCDIQHSMEVNELDHY